jgi:hypothetical protein
MDSLNELIMAAQALLDGNFDIQAFLGWQTLAFLTLLSLLGPFHYYTQNFKKLTSEKTPRGLLAGEGVLVAAREHFLKIAGAIRSRGDIGREQTCN